MTGLMKTVLRHRRQASINTKLGQRRPASAKQKYYAYTALLEFAQRIYIYGGFQP